MKLFFIRHKGTGLYFPTPYENGKKGGTHTTPCEHPESQYVRIFRTKKSAVHFIRQWSLGKHYIDVFDEEDPHGWTKEIAPVEGRNAEDFEIIERDVKKLP